MAVDGNVVTLGFPEEQAFLKDAAERKRAGARGRRSAPSSADRWRVRCVVTNVEIAAARWPPDDVLAEARRIFADDLVDVGEVS